MKHRTRSYLIAGALVVVVGAFGTFPLWYRMKMANISQKDRLSASQVQRGMYMQVGARDMGRDPNYDFKTGEYRRKSPASDDESQ